MQFKCRALQRSEEEALSRHMSPVRSTGVTLAVLALASVVITTTEIVVSPADATDLPTFDINRVCKADAAAEPGSRAGASCVNDEQAARQTLSGSWNTFDEVSRGNCLQLVGDISGTQSYVELLSCLQTAAAAKKIPGR